MMRAGIAALEGRAGEARAGFRDVLATWRDMGLPWRLAQTAIVMATVLGPDDPEVVGIADEARAILALLGARRFFEHLDFLMSKEAASAASPSPVSTPAGH